MKHRMRCFGSWSLDKGIDVRNGSVERAAAGVVITLREDGTVLATENGLDQTVR